MDLVEIVKAYLNKETIEYTESDEMKALINLSIQQSLQPLLYPVFQEKSLKKYYIGWVVKQEEFRSVQAKVSEILNEASVNHLFFKGSILHEIYDDPTVRTRGDIDLYVDIKDFEKVKEVFVSNGFEIDKHQDCVYHLVFKYKGLMIELHHRLFDDGSSNSWVKAFKNPFELSESISNNSYKLRPTEHFIYCMCHFAHHLRTGAGLRYVLDFYYMLEKTNIDYDLLHKMLKELKLETLYKNVLNEIYLLTNKRYDNVEIIDIKFFTDYLLSYGIHGNSNNETSHQSSLHTNKFKYFISRVFLTNKSYRMASHPKLGKHWYLYPICLIVHWFYLLTHNLKSGFKFIFGRNHNKDLYSKLGV